MVQQIKIMKVAISYPDEQHAADVQKFLDQGWVLHTVAPIVVLALSDKISRDTHILYVLVKKGSGPTKVSESTVASRPLTEVEKAGIAQERIDRQHGYDRGIY